jgi:serine/threonine protein kinase
MNHEETIFEQALGIASTSAREEFLRGACEGNEAMFERLQGLLRAHDRAGKFLGEARVTASDSSSPGGPAASPMIDLPLTEKPGDRIGRYKLLQKIGEGGCGIVYMAEQEEPVRRRVALKIIKLGMDTRQVIARFEAERQALALMDHPNIAKVFDAGVTENPHPASGRGVAESQISNFKSQIHAGRPYFVMELVRGVKITEYCDEKKLSPQERLELFMQVCRAVQHAHQKGIIHRDLKPSNVLVSVNDGEAVPKVIDFGIAKATTGEPLTDKTVFTAFEQFIGTPAYMSPEQALVTSLDIDTRTDIYALGVLLYELLTGHTPFDPKDCYKTAWRRCVAPSANENRSVPPRG